MGCVVDHFCFLNLGQSKDVLNVLDMPTAAFVYQDQTEGHESSKAQPREGCNGVIEADALHNEDSRGKSANEQNGGDDVDCQYSSDGGSVARLAQVFGRDVRYVCRYASFGVGLGDIDGDHDGGVRTS